jgi:hypothetical protein
MRDGLQVDVDDTTYTTQVVDCGALVAPYGKLIACDPFVFLYDLDQPFIAIPPGTYPIYVTIADVNLEGDGSDLREAYATLILDTAPEHIRRIITPLASGEVAAPEMVGDSYDGFPVDAGTACFVDAGALADGMPPPEDDWNEALFDNGTPESWFNRMDDPAHIRAGLANIALPLAKDGANIVIIHSGWGDGIYPVVGGYAEDGRLVRVHIDFLVVFSPDGEAEEE